MAAFFLEPWQPGTSPWPPCTPTSHIPSPFQSLLRGLVTSTQSPSTSSPPMAVPVYPGAEAYAHRHARAAAIPLEQRSRDVRTFLEAHQLLDQVAAVLSSSTAPESERVVAILQCATTAFAALDLQPNMLHHPGCLAALGNGHTAALMRPFVRPHCSPGTDHVTGFEVNDRLIQQIGGPTASPVRSMQTIARLCWWRGGSQ